MNQNLLVVVLVALVPVCSSQTALGAPSDWNLDEARAALDEAYASRMNGSKDEHRRRIIKIESATKQLVAGISKKVVYLDGQTTCTQQVPLEEVTEERCPFDKEGRVERCEMKIWEQVWNPEHDDSPKFECSTLSGDEKVQAFAQRKIQGFCRDFVYETTQ